MRPDKVPQSDLLDVLHQKMRPTVLSPDQAVAFLDNTTEAGMMCETAAKRTVGMEGNGGGLPK